MHNHQNYAGGGHAPAQQPRHLRCPHCGDDGVVFTDEPHSHALPCPGCTYGRLRSAKWVVAHGVAVQVTPSHYRGVTWENGVTLAHTASCGAPEDARRHPDGYRCRRPALPATGGRAPLCDVHARGVTDAPSGDAVQLVATARSRHAEWEATAEARRAVEAAQ
jgi:hypothetical protein